MYYKTHLLIIALLATLGTMAAHAAGNQDERHNVGQSGFDKYAREVEDLSKNAGPESRAVIATIRIPAGTTIDPQWLSLIPLIDYSQTSNGLPQPRLLKRSADEFGSIGDVAGRVVLKDIAEQGKITHDQVGGFPSEQFKIGPDTRFKVHYQFRRGATLPGAAAEIHECTLESANMPPKEAADLQERLLRSNILLESGVRYEILAGGYENYLVAVTIGPVTKEVSWSGKHAPGTVWNLVDYLERHSQKQIIPGTHR